MADIEGYKKYLQGRKFDTKTIKGHISAVLQAEKVLCKKNATLDSLKKKDIGRIISFLKKCKKQAMLINIALIRYFNFKRKYDVMVPLLEMVDGVDVMSVLKARIQKAEGKKTSDAIFKGIRLPTVGTPLKQYPVVAKRVMDRMIKILYPEKARKIMCSGLHGGPIPKKEQQAIRQRLLKTGDIDKFLAQEHKDYIDELKEIMDSGKMYYTQPITPDVLNHVRKEPFISGVRKGNIIYTIKIPYMTQKYLDEKDPVLQRYYYCHCPWVRESIKDGKPQVPDFFCNCSAGFTKFYFDAVFNSDVRCDVVDTVLGGSSVCLFAVQIPKKDYGLIKTGGH